MYQQLTELRGKKQYIPGKTSIICDLPKDKNVGTHRHRPRS